jgi:hypothetical protein
MKQADPNHGAYNELGILGKQLAAWQYNTAGEIVWGASVYFPGASSSWKRDATTQVYYDKAQAICAETAMPCSFNNGGFGEDGNNKPAGIYAKQAAQAFYTKFQELNQQGNQASAWAEVSSIALQISRNSGVYTGSNAANTYTGSNTIQN